jgi:hypothetical protein
MEGGEDESEREGNNKDSKGWSYTRGWNARGVNDWFEGVEEQGDYWCSAWGWIAGRPPYAMAEQSDVKHKMTMFKAGSIITTIIEILLIITSLFILLSSLSLTPLLVQSWFRGNLKGTEQ